MVFQTCLLFGFIMFSFSFAADLHNHECDKLGILLYEDLGCSPVIKEGAKCPSKFDCGSFERKKDSCRFHSKSIAVQQQLDSKDTYASCNVGCSCRGQENEKADFTCAVLDCPEWLGSPLKFNCYRKYDLGQCCSSGQICAPFDNIKKCTVDGKDHQEGQKFSPENTCLDCVCQKDFAGKYDEKTCMRRLCAAQLRHSEDIENYCAPAYFVFGDSFDVLCCPSTWICPNTDIKIKKINPDAKEDPDLTCKFGKDSLKLGEGFEKTINEYGKDRLMKCECALPPFVTCKETSS